MTLLPLDQIRIDARSHASALRWVGLLYCKPKKVNEAEKPLRSWVRLAALLRSYFHLLPYLFLVCILLRHLDWRLGLAIDPSAGSSSLWWAQFIIFILIVMFASGLAFGLSLGLASAIIFTIYFCSTGAIGYFVAGLAGGVFIVALLGPGLDGVVAYTSTGMFVRVFVGFMGFGSLIAVGGIFGPKGSDAMKLYFGTIVLGFLLGFFRSYYVATNYLFIWTDLYRFHPVVWDDVCVLPFPGLDRILIRYAEYDHNAGRREIDRLIDEYPSQRSAAIRARAILVARRAAAATDLAQLDEILASLPAGEKGFLKETPELRRRVHEITVLRARLDTLDRPFLREPFAGLLVKEIETFEQQIVGFKPPLSTELRKAARQWLVIARRQLDGARAAVTREPTHQVFRAGDPVNREREAFVLRAAILGEFERQVMLASGCPGLLVYGRRRVGKSTLLRNLEGLLPPRVLVVSLSMQEARAFTSTHDLIALIFQRVAAVLPDEGERPADLKGLERFLEGAQNRLDAEDRRLLLAIDEYENLDSKIGEGALSEDLLAVIRESIQTHRRLIWAFAGSHGIDELVHAPWTSYLVSARTIEVTAFEPAETRLLLTEPLKHSSLWRASGAEPPRFEPGFWGEGGIERIHAEAGGWPHLVQLVAETVVDLVNDAGGASVDSALLERALDRAVVRGNNVFLELLERESRLSGEWDYLREFRRAETQPVPADEALERSLRRRRLVVEEDGRYRLRVPIMARWLRQRV